MITEKGIKKAGLKGEEKDWIEEFVRDGIIIRRTKEGMEYPACLDIDQTQFSKPDKDKKKG